MQNEIGNNKKFCALDINLKDLSVNELESIADFINVKFTTTDEKILILNIEDLAIMYKEASIKLKQTMKDTFKLQFMEALKAMIANGFMLREMGVIPDGN